MQKITILLLIAAFEKYGTNIDYVSDKTNWEQCVQSIPELNCYYLYFNTPDHSTHVVKMRV